MQRAPGDVAGANPIVHEKLKFNHVHREWSHRTSWNPLNHPSVIPALRDQDRDLDRYAIYIYAPTFSFRMRQSHQDLFYCNDTEITITGSRNRVLQSAQDWRDLLKHAPHDLPVVVCIIQWRCLSLLALLCLYHDPATSGMNNAMTAVQASRLLQHQLPGPTPVRVQATRVVCVSCLPYQMNVERALCNGNQEKQMQFASAICLIACWLTFIHH